MDPIKGIEPIAARRAEAPSSSSSPDCFDAVRLHPQQRAWPVRSDSLPTASKKSSLRSAISQESSLIVGGVKAGSLTAFSRGSDFQGGGQPLNSHINSHTQPETNTGLQSTHIGHDPSVRFGGLEETTHLRRTSNQESRNSRRSNLSLRPKASELFPVLENSATRSHDGDHASIYRPDQGFDTHPPNTACESNEQPNGIEQEEDQGQADMHVPTPARKSPSSGQSQLINRWINSMQQTSANASSIRREHSQSSVAAGPEFFQLHPRSMPVRSRRSTQASLASIASSVMLSRVNTTETNLLTSECLSTLRALGPEPNEHSSFSNDVGFFTSDHDVQSENREIQRRNVLKEILATERAYVTDLMLLDKVSPRPKWPHVLQYNDEDCSPRT